MPSNRKTQRRSRQPKRKTRRRSQRPKPKLSSAQLMLLDPCSASLTHALSATDEGILSSLRSTYVHDFTQQHGFIVWFPDYATDGAYNATYDTGNLFIYATTNPNTAPVNTIANPFGSGQAAGMKLAGGATAFLKSATVSDLQQISSCIDVVYTGTTLESKGIITPISNLSPDALLRGGTGGGPASISQLFALMQDTRRVGLQAHSVRSRPNSALHGAFQTEVACPILVGHPTNSVSAIPQNIASIGPTAIGFAWSGIPTGDLYFTLTQNVEWRPDVAAGFRATLPKQVSSANTIAAALQKLDKQFPGWTTMAKRTVASALQGYMTYAHARQRMLR